MHISKITIKNFKGFVDRTIDFYVPDGVTAGSGLNIFVGENGSGKTTVLESIGLLTQSRLKTKSRISIKDFYDFQKEIEIVAKTEETFEVKKLYGGKSFQANGFRFYAKTRDIDSKGKLLDPLVFDSEVTTDAEIKYPAEKRIEVGTPYGSRLPNFKIIYLDKNRVRHTKKGDWAKTKLDEIFDDFNFHFIKNFQKNENLKAFNDQAREHYLANSNDAANKVLLPFIKKVNAKLGISDLKVDFIEILQPFSSAFFSKRTKDGYRQILIENLGSGIEMLLAFLLLEEVYSFEDDNIIYCIDEPEIHLHPQFQKKFFEILKEISRTKQVFISTHSPYFIDPDLIENIYRFENNDKNIGVNSFQIKPKDEDEKKQVRNLLNLENREIFFARSVVLIEGTVDRVRFRKFLQNLGEKDFFVVNGLENKGVASRICRDLHIPFYMITDLDYLYGKCDPGLSDEEKQKIHEYRELEKLLPIAKAQDEYLGKFLREGVFNPLQKEAKKLCSSQMLVKIEGDEKYRKQVEGKIIKEKENGIYVLRYGMLENYLDENGGIKDGNNKTEREEELRKFFEVQVS